MRTPAVSFVALALALLATLTPRHVRAEEASPHADASTVEFTADSTRAGTVIERRANRVRGWQYSVPPVYQATDQWETACVVPCRVRIDPNNVFHVGGGDVAPSGAFTLPAGPGPFHVRVDAGSHFLHTLGLSSVGVGLGTFVFGGFVYVNAGDGADARTTKNVGEAIVGAGLLVAAAGLVTWLVTESSVDVAPAPPR
jgi:hypothetical protein